ncbi:MAG: hypothetical protein AB7P31_05845 [Steroidobacteraceae bacterium]
MPSRKPPVRIKRVAKGKRPQYFSDPAIDKLLWVTVTLAQELAVTRDRLDAVERLLGARGVLKAGAVDAYAPSPAITAERDQARAAFIARILRIVKAEVEEVTGEGQPRSQQDVVDAVSR